MLISKVLMSLKCCVCIFDGVSVCDNHFPIFAPSLQLRNLVIQLYATRYGGAIKLGPRHPVNLTKLDSFVDGVYSPCFGGDWMSLNAKKVNKLTVISFLTFSLSLSLAQGSKGKTVV